MLNAVLKTSVLTGVFCALFAAVIDLVTEALSMWIVIVLAFCSGFVGSFAAQLIQRKFK